MAEQSLGAARRAALVTLGLACALLPGRAAAGDELLDSLQAIDQLSLEDVLNAPTQVASRTARSLREAAGIVTVITREEIVASGARDLGDVLQQVPGFALAQDVTGTVGVGFRGNWGFEGKVLVLVDGHELNEPLYLSVPVGAELPVEMVERVEIVRGPGSVVHGGYAELAVINVTTRRAETLRGFSVATRLSGLPDSGTWGRRNLQAAWGEVFDLGGPLRLSGTLYLNEAHRSGAEQLDADGFGFSMGEDSALDSALVSLNAAWRDLKLGFLYQDWNYLDRTGYDEALPRAVWGRFRGTFFHASYQLALPYGFAVEPRLRVKRQTPWQVTDVDAETAAFVYYDRSAQRTEGSLSLTWQGLSWLSVLAGGSFTHDRAWVNDYDGEDGFADGSAVSYDNVAAYAEIVSRKLVDVTAGARFERHSVYGNSFVPRLALTKVLGGFHAKALYAQAFKAPGIENISSNAQIAPERTTAYELELGYLFLPQLYASVSGFYLDIDDPILYDVDLESGEEMYLNAPSSGACGAEAELRYKGARGRATLSYAFYTAACASQPELYAVPGHSEAVLGFANHKVALSGSVETLPRLYVSPTLLFFSGRWFMSEDEEGNPRAQLARPAFLVDLFVTYKGAALRGVSLSAGVHNLLGQRFDYVQPYAGGKPPMRGFDREIALRLSYDMP